MNIILGPPGAGKGTQCNLLKKKLNIYHLSAGDLLRKHYGPGTPERERLNNGLYIQVEKINTIMEQEIKSHNYNVLIDGYPRSLEQAQFISQFPISNIFILYSNEYDILLQRILKRSQCKICNSIYSIDTICCDLKTIRRNDDNEIAFKKRYDLFMSNFFDVLFRLNKQVIFLDATKDINSIHQRIIKHITV